MESNKPLIEQVLDKHEWLTGGGWTKEGILAAMTEYSSLMNKEKDEKIAELQKRLEEFERPNGIMGMK